MLRIHKYWLPPDKIQPPGRPTRLVKCRCKEGLIAIIACSVQCKTNPRSQCAVNREISVLNIFIFVHSKSTVFVYTCAKGRLLCCEHGQLVVRTIPKAWKHWTSFRGVCCSRYCWLDLCRKVTKDRYWTVSRKSLIVGTWESYLWNP